jgi:cytoskeletal protein RodZ
MEFLIMAIWGVIVGVICCYLYFLPGVIAGYRKHKHRTLITWLNLILGWTVLAWIGLLVWALMSENTNDYTKQLINLSELKEKGVITEEEFNKEKSKLLNENN